MERVFIKTTDSTGDNQFQMGMYEIVYDDFDENEYYRKLKERQDEHYKRITDYREWGTVKPFKRPFQPCMHDSCIECCGTGIRIDGSLCIHMISCNCPKCTPYCM